jgi:hypothetical protein
MLGVSVKEERGAGLPGAIIALVFHRDARVSHRNLEHFLGPRRMQNWAEDVGMNHRADDRMEPPALMRCGVVFGK